MTQRALQVCNEPGCMQLVRAARCEQHAKQQQQEQQSKHRHLYNRRWERRSKRHRKLHPMCAECAEHGVATAAYCTDHIIPHRGDLELFCDEDNWQSLCERCHNAKTARGE